MVIENNKKTTGEDTEMVFPWKTMDNFSNRTEKDTEIPVPRMRKKNIDKRMEIPLPKDKMRDIVKRADKRSHLVANVIATDL
jgi:hypothetical protein